MPKPPASPPASDITGVNRDARIQKPDTSTNIDPGQILKQAKKQSIGRPEQTPPDEKPGGVRTGPPQT